MNAHIVELINIIVENATDYLMPFLLFAFIIAVLVRLLISVIISRQRRFVKEFCKRVHRDLTVNPGTRGSFYSVVRRYLTSTYFETFETRAKYKRRNEDYVMSIGDRFFLIQDGVIRLIDDFLKHVKYLPKDEDHNPNFHQISNNAFASNPVFSRVFGIFSVSRTNDILNILPGIFIVAGIFGTFLGIMKALPELTGMDITNAETSKVVIDSFLIKISFALSTSILGIVLSIIMSFLNAFLSPESTYVEIVDSFKSATEILWNKCDNNNPDEIPAGGDTEAEEAFELAIANMYARVSAA